MARQAERKAAHRMAILDAAEQLLARSGDDVSIEAVAHRAGLAKGTIYNHFANKDALLRAVARRVREVAAEKVTVAVNGIEDAPSRLAAGIGVYLALARDDPDRGAILARLIQEAIDPAAPINATLLAELERGNARGDLDAHPARAGVTMVLAVVQAAMMTAMGRDGRLPDAEAAEALAKFVTVALTARQK